MDAPSLLRALREPSVTEQEILGLLKSLYAQLDTYSHEAFTPQEFDRVGSDELSCMSTPRWWQNCVLIRPVSPASKRPPRTTPIIRTICSYTTSTAQSAAWNTASRPGP